MSEIVIVSFRIENGIITEATERRPKPLPVFAGRALPTVLTERGDIEVAVARVANAAGRFKQDSNEEKR